MKNYLLSLFLLCMVIAGYAQNSADEKEVRKLNAALDEAIKNADVVFYENLLAPDYVYYGPDGSMKNRDEVLREVKKQKENPTYQISELKSEDVKVKLNGNLAVVTAKWDSTSNLMEDPEAHKDSGHYIAVYEKKNGNWKLTSELSTEKPHAKEDLKRTLEKASNKYNMAIRSRDSTAFRNLLAKDYSSTNSSGKVSTAKEDIAMMFDPKLEIQNLTTEDQNFKVYRDFAVETGKFKVDGTYNGENFTEQGRYTTTWKFENGKWKIVSDHTGSLQPEK